MKQTIYAILFIVALFVIAASVTGCSKTTVYSKSIDNCPTWVSKTK